MAKLEIEAKQAQKQHPDIMLILAQPFQCYFLKCAYVRCHVCKYSAHLCLETACVSVSSWNANNN